MTDKVTVSVFLAVCSVPYFAPCCILPTTYCLRLSAVTQMAKLCLGRGDRVTKWRSDRGTRRRLEDEERRRAAERGGRR